MELKKEHHDWCFKCVQINYIPKLSHHNPLAFSQEFVEEAVKLLITRFIPLNPKDLNAWSTDPEEWMNMEDKDNEQWEYELRVRREY